MAVWKCDMCGATVGQRHAPYCHMYGILTEPPAPEPTNAPPAPKPRPTDNELLASIANSLKRLADNSDGIRVSLLNIDTRIANIRQPDVLDQIFKGHGQ